MNKIIQGAVLTAVVAASVYGMISYGKPAGEPDEHEYMAEFVCEEGDDITETWFGLRSAVLVNGSNMWEITSLTDDITYFVQKPGQRCASRAYEVESVDTSSVRS